MGLLLPVALAAAFASTPSLTPLTADERKVQEKEWEDVMRAGLTARRNGDDKAAEEAFRRVLPVARRLYPPGEFPDGHSRLALTMYNLARLMHIRGNAADAEPLLRDALSMVQRIYRVQDDSLVAEWTESLAGAVGDLGKAAEAEQLFREALAMSRRLSAGKDDAAVVRGLSNLAGHLASSGKFGEAASANGEALEILGRLYPKQNHSLLASALNSQGDYLRGQSRFAEAERYDRDSLAMYQALYPHRDHPHVARSLNNVGFVLQRLGRYSHAEAFLREALEMRERLHKREDHADIARSLNNLADLLTAAGKATDAELLHRAALEMERRLHPKQDHTDIARSLNNLAFTLRELDRAKDAESLFREAVAMRRRLYPKQDHPHLANCLNNLAHHLLTRGELSDAEALFREALDMVRRLYPEQDHPQVAGGMINLATALNAMERQEEAGKLLLEAERVYRRLLTGFADRMAEGESLTFATTLPLARDAYLSNAFAIKSKPVGVYAELFADRGVLTRIYEQRHLLARATATDPATANLLNELTDARRRRAELLFAPPTKDAPTLKKRKEETDGYEKTIREKEQAVRKTLPAVTRVEKLAKATPADLQKALPDNAVVIDFLRWVHFEYEPQKSGKEWEKRTSKYLAFVVTKTEVKWVDLGPADAVEKAVAAWRAGIAGDEAKGTPPATAEEVAKLGEAVRELVWAKPRKELPKGVTTVYVCPDAALCRVPWAAVPGDKGGTVLIDEFAVAAVPHAPFILDQLRSAEERKNPPSGVLAVGGVKYDAKPPALPKADPLVARPVGPLVDEKAKVVWEFLLGSEAEVKGLVLAADKRKLAAVTLTGEQATPQVVLAALPKVQYAHLATHGFFAAPKFRSAFDLDEQDYRMSPTGERVGRAVNSPLVMSGLVLAGANHPNTPGRGIVTGEALVDLDLSGLELAVLSACETGLGDVAGGEGSYGLQRAFHYTGARNVVASLWKVPDEGTAALMGSFYRHLWEKDLPPIEALRQAQLELRRADSKKIADLAKGFRGTFLKVPGSGAEEKTFDLKPSNDGATHPLHWAAFTLSGVGK